MTMLESFAKVIFHVSFDVNTQYTLFKYIVAISTVMSECDDGSVRLVGGSGDHEGRVEVCMNQAWGSVCADGWDNTDGDVVCNQLGFLNRG